MRIRTSKEIYLDTIALCPHITLRHVEMCGKNNHSEYIEDITIVCTECNNEFLIEILVN